MKDEGITRRDFLKSAVAGGAVAATSVVAVPQAAEVQQKPVAPAHPGYAYLNPERSRLSKRWSIT
jgi:hypothetical protein